MCNLRWKFSKSYANYIRQLIICDRVTLLYFVFIISFLYYNFIIEYFYKNQFINRTFLFVLAFVYVKNYKKTPFPMCHYLFLYLIKVILVYYCFILNSIYNLMKNAEFYILKHATVSGQTYAKDSRIICFRVIIP